MLTWDEEVKPSSQKPTDGWPAKRPPGSAVAAAHPDTCIAANSVLQFPLPQLPLLQPLIAE